MAKTVKEKREEAQKRLSEREASSSSLNTNSVSSMREKASLRNQIGIDTLQSDYETANEILGNAYSSWQDADTMASYKNTVGAMNDRLSAYKTYSSKYGDLGNFNSGALNQAADFYNKAMGSWDDVAGTYSNYKDKDAYEKGMRKQSYREKYSGKTYDEIKAALESSDMSTEERRYMLNEYTDYLNVDDFNKAIKDATNPDRKNTLTNLRDNYSTMHAYDKYEGLSENKDFAANSLAGKKVTETNRNNEEYETDIKTTDSLRRELGAVISYDQLPERMKATAAYIFNTQGQAAYMDFMDEIAVQAAKENNEVSEGKFREFADNHPILATAADVAGNVAVLPFVASEEAGEIATTGSYNPYAGASGLYNNLKAGTQEVSQNIANSTEGLELFGENVPSFLYNALAVSGLESRAGNMVMGGLYAPFMGAGAFSSSYKEGLERGLSPDNAAKTALASGIAEGLFEYVSWEALLKNSDANSIKNIFKNFGKQFIAEGSEEMNTDISNAISDWLINGGMSEFNQNRKQYEERGYSAKEAGDMAWSDLRKQIAESFVAGGISGGFSAGGFSALNYARNSATGKEVNGEKLAAAIQGIGSGNVYDEYAKLTQQYGENLSNKSGIDYNAQLGSLYNAAVNESIQTKNKEDIKQYLLEQGRTEEDAERLAEAVVAIEPTRDQRKLIKSQNARNIASDMKEFYKGKERVQSKESAKAEFNAARVIESTKDFKEADTRGLKIGETTSVNGEATKIIGVSGNKVLTDKGAYSAKEITLTESDAKLVQTAFENYKTTNVRNAFIENYSGQDLKAYSENFDLAFAAGRYGLKDDLDNLIDNNVIDKTAAEKIYIASYEDNATRHQEIEKGAEALNKKWEGKLEAGKFTDQDVKLGDKTYNLKQSSLTSTEKIMYNFLKTFSRTGINFAVYKDTSDNSFNGEYDKKTNTVYINLAANYYAGMSWYKGRKYVVNTVAHELTHWLQINGTESYGYLEEAIKEAFGNTGYEKLVAKEMFDKSGKQILSRKAAEDEVIARACEDMLNDTEVMSNILSNLDETKLEKVKNDIIDFFADIKSFFDDMMKNYAGSSADAAKMLRENEEAFNQVKKIWLEGITGAINNIKEVTATEDTETRKSVKEESEEINDVNKSLTMEQCKGMLERVLNVSGWRKTEGYKNVDDMLNGESAEEIAMMIESEYDIYMKYLSGLEMLGETFTTEDIIEAYINGTLVGKEAKKATRIDTSKPGLQDYRFYSPQNIENYKELFEIANQRANNSNRDEVAKARAKILIFAHNEGAASLLGISKADFTKKLRSWTRYTQNAIDISKRINSGSSSENRWAGIENCTWLNRASVTDEELDALVGSIKGETTQFQRNYIVRTMLALDTHIDYKELNFDIVKGFVSPEKHSTKGVYQNSNRTITINEQGAPHTVAHEMGHYLDYKWGRDFGKGLPFTELCRRASMADNQFAVNFGVFLDSLEKVSDIRNSYTMDSKEVFARFVARFVQWTDNLANNSNYQETEFYNDKFTTSQFIEFAKLLQEKSAIDAESVRYSTKEDSEGNLLTNNQKDYFVNSKARNEEGKLYKLWHGSRYGAFSEFDTTAGIWLSTDRKYALEYSELYGENDSENTGLESEVYDNAPDAVGYGDRMYSLYANIENPLDLGYINVAVNESRLLELSRAIGITDVADHRKLFELAEGVDEMWEVTKTSEFIEIAKKYGYDGLKAVEGARDRIDTFCAFEENQVKLTTNENPTDNTDIRYARKEENDIIRFYNPIKKETYRTVNDVYELSSDEVKALNESIKKFYAELLSDNDKTENIEKTAKTIALGISSVFDEEGFDYTGIKISSDKKIAATQIASISMVLRNSHYETSRVIYIKNDEIVGCEAYTSGKEASVYAFGKISALNGEEYQNAVIEKLKHYGADSFYVLHNHPDGNPTPSDLDIKSNRRDRRLGKMFKGSIIIDHNEYSYIPPYGKKDIRKSLPDNGKSKDINVRIIDSDILYTSIDLKNIGNYARSLAHDDDYTVVIFANNNGIVAVQEVPNKIVLMPEFSKYLEKYRVVFGSHFTAIASADSDVLDAESVKKAYYSNLLSERIIYEPIVNNSDERKSRKVEYEVADILGEKNRLEKENTKLKADIVKLTERIKLNNTVTDGKMYKRSLVEAAAKALLKSADSTYDMKTLADELDDFYHFMQDPTSVEEDLQAETINERAYEIAGKILDKQKPTKKRNDEAAEQLETIRRKRIRLSPETVEELKRRDGDKWRNHYMGRIMITKDGATVESVYNSLAADYPWLFDASISNELDMLDVIDETYDSIRDTRDIIEYHKSAEDVRYLAVDIFDKFWTMANEVTVADKHAAEVKALKEEHRRTVAELKQSMENQKLADEMYFGKKLEQQRQRSQAEINKVKAQQLTKEEALTKKKYYQDMVKNVRDKKNAEIANLKKHQQELKEKQKEALRKKAAIEKINDNATTLMDWMNKNSAKEHVPDILKKPVSSLLNAIDFSSKQLLGITKQEKNPDKYMTPTKRDVSITKSLQAMRELVLKVETAYSGEGEITDTQIAELISAFPPGYSEVLKQICDVANNITQNYNEDNAYVLNRMNADELEALAGVVRTMRKAVQNLNRALAGRENQTISQFAQQTIFEDMEELGNDKIKNELLKKTRNFLNWDNATPIYAFKRMGKGAMSIFYNLMNGWDRFAKNVNAINEFVSKLYTADDVAKWEKEIHSFDISRVDNEGNVKTRTIQLTTTQMMSLYCLSRRDQAQGHIFGGGIKIADIKNGRDVITQSKSVNLSSTEVENIINELRADEKAIHVAEELQRYMSKVGGAWGNEVTQRRWNIDGFTEEFYFPIQSNPNNLPVQPRQNAKSIYALLNLSFTKALTTGANNDIVIDDIFTVFTIHMSEMAKYNALALPVLDAIKWYNYKESGAKDENGNFETESVKTALENTFGNRAGHYVMNFLEDLNGTQESGRGEGTLKNLVRNFKVAQVGFNLQVVALQPISLFRAGYAINEKYVAAGVAKRGQIEKAQKYCGIVLWKKLGFYDTNISRGLDSIIRNGGADARKWSKEWIQDKSLAWAEKADEWTLGHLWNACEAEIGATTNLKYDSEEYNQAVAERLREVIYKTQVVDSTMTRSDNMRSQSLAVQMVTAFMSEPTLSLNMLQDAGLTYFDELRKGKNGSQALSVAGPGIIRAAKAYIICSVVESVIRGLIGKARAIGNDKDKDTITDKMLQQFLEELNLLNKVPIAKDVVSIFQGYTSSNSELAFAQNAYYAYKSIEKNGLGNYKSIYRTATSLGQITGIPAGDIVRELSTIWNVSVAQLYPELTIEK